MNGSTMPALSGGCEASRHARAHIRTAAELRDSPPETLIGYIVRRHHARVRKVIPSILSNAEEAAQIDGARHPEFNEIAERLARLAVDLTLHMHKDETAVFPYIGAAAAAIRKNRPLPDAPLGSLDALITVLE